MSSLHQKVHLLCKHISADITPRNGWLLRCAPLLDEVEKDQSCQLILHKLDSDKNNILLGSRFRTWLGSRSKNPVVSPEALLGYLCPHEPARLVLYFNEFRVKEEQEYTHVLRIARKRQNYEWVIASCARVWKTDTEPLAVLTLLMPINELLQQQTPPLKSTDMFALSVYEKLGTRERQVLRLIGKGMNDSLVADELNISKLTVKTYRQELRRKFEVKNTAGLVIYATKLKF